MYRDSAGVKSQGLSTKLTTPPNPWHENYLVHPGAVQEETPESRWTKTEQDKDPEFVLTDAGMETTNLAL